VVHILVRSGLRTALNFNAASIAGEMLVFAPGQPALFSAA
jgi:hypothetical protein